MNTNKFILFRQFLPLPPFALAAVNSLRLRCQP
jgi:hypothetical protein